MLNRFFAPRALFFIVFLFCAGLIAYALFAQYVQHYEPCMLCMVQRVFVVALGLSALLAALHNPRGWGYKIYGLLCALWATIGAYVAGRHVYLQSLPPEQLEGCSPSFEYVMKNYELGKMFRTFFIRDQDCGVIDWVFLGMSMPRWVLICFIALGLLCLWRGFTANKVNR